MNRSELADLNAFVAVPINGVFEPRGIASRFTPSALTTRCGSWRSASDAVAESHDAAAIGWTDPACACSNGCGRNQRDRRRNRGLNQAARAAHGAAADLCDPYGGGGHRADLGTLLVDVSETCTLSSRWGEAPIDIVAKGLRWPGSDPRRVAGRHDCRFGEWGPMKIAVVGAPAYFARRPPRTPMISSVTAAFSIGGRRRRNSRGRRAEPQSGGFP